MKIKSLFAASTLAAMTALTPMAQASYLLTFQDVTFTMDVVDSNSLSLRIQNALSTTDADWASATKFGALALKDLGLDFSVTTASATYFGIPNQTVNGVRDELSASTINAGADCVFDANAPVGSICFDFVDFALTDDMNFQIDFSQNYTIDAGGPHLKVAFVSNNGNKVGSLLSQDLPFSSSSTSSSGLSSSSGTIPEPSSSGLAVLGLGLVAASFALRRKSRQY